MNKIKFTAATVAGAMLAGTTWLYAKADGKEIPAYRTAPVTRATLTSTVSATGTLSAVRTVQVGTQVSGQVSQIFVDFNDHVKKGQLLARIDPKLAEQAVQDAQAQLERAQAQLSLAQDEYARNKQLFDARVITASEFATTQSNFTVQQATVKSAQIQLDRAKQNLSYTEIYAPIDGVIVERNVDVGQTVAASLSAPQLFLIANDLSDMQILAAVDESDIGLIKGGASAQFTVQSYPNERFEGKVQQVRLQSTTVDNVVSYTAVVAVKNTSGKLLPGMTATVQFVTGSANNVLTVPNAALRIKPTPEMLAEVSDSATADSGQRIRRDSSVTRQRPDSATRARFAAARAGQHSGTIWYVDSAGALHSARVRTGRTDGQKTEIEGRGISDGMQVIIGVSDASGTAGEGSSAARNPFQPQRGNRGPRL